MNDDLTMTTYTSTLATINGADESGNNSRFDIATVSTQDLADLGEELRKEMFGWQKDFIPILPNKKKRRLFLELIAKRRGLPYKTVEKKFYRFRNHGLAGLVDRRAAGSKYWNCEDKIGIPDADRQLLKTYCEANQRGNEAAIRELRRHWKIGVVTSDAPLDLETTYPKGWSERNLARLAPDELELAAARQGREATAAHRSLVYTTRRHLYVGQYYLFDDIWHDHTCNLLATRQTGRPLEFHGLDLASAYKMCWGMRLRREVNGVMESLKEEDFRFLLASFLFSHGYHPKGTTLVVEHATTKIDERTEQLLGIATGGAIKVFRGPMSGASVHAGQYAGRAKGNFRIKGALESLGNLMHNEFATLPGQTGKDRQHCPEQLHGMLKHNDALMHALSQIPPERAAWLQWDLCTLQQFQLIAQEVYARINARTKHDLEGWDERYVPCPQTGRMRRMSPTEVWTPGSRALRPISAEVAAMIVGTSGGKERQVRNGEIEITMSEISGDPLRFDARQLPSRGKFLAVLNPFDTKRLTLFDAKGRYVTTIDRIHAPCRSNVDAVHAACGRAESALNERLLPMRARAMKQARAKAARHRHNDRVLDTSRPFTIDEKEEAKEMGKRVTDVRNFLPEPELLSPGELAGEVDWRTNDFDETPIADGSEFVTNV